jgi:hypothetical protein
MRLCVSQIAELQNVRVLPEEARIEEGTHPEHRYRRLDASLRAALRDASRRPELRDLARDLL